MLRDTIFLLQVRPLFTRFTKFGLVGGLGTIVYYLVLWFLVEVLSIPVLTSTTIAFFLVIIENYILHYRWTFDCARPHAATFPRFLIMNFIGLGINYLVVLASMTMMQLHYMVAQTFAIVAVISWNLVLCSAWIFVEKIINPGSAAE